MNETMSSHRWALVRLHQRDDMVLTFSKLWSQSSCVVHALVPTPAAIMVRRFQSASCSTCAFVHYSLPTLAVAVLAQYWRQPPAEDCSLPSEAVCVVVLGAWSLQR